MISKITKEELTSVNNPLIKQALKLWENHRARKEAKAFVIEGAREIEKALAHQWKPQTIFICKDRMSDFADKIINDAKLDNKLFIPVNEKVFEKLAVRKDTDGLFAIFQDKEIILDEVKLKDKPLVVILDGVEKPGNLGAIIRTADGAGVDLVILTGACPSPLSPQSIRGSLGTVFSVPIIKLEHDVATSFCKKNNLFMVGAALSPRSRNYNELDYTKGVALVMGSEAFGISKLWLDSCDQLAIIPMLGDVDSLNVGVAAGVLMYEARRNIG